MLFRSAIDEIRRAGVLACNFSCNNAHQFELVRELSPHFDVNLHAEKGATEKFAAIGAAPLWWPMASNPKYFRPHDLPRTIEASFVGTNYALRARYVKRLLDAKIDVHAYGPAWTGGARSPLRSAAKRALLQLRAMTARRGAAQTRASALLAEHEFRRLLARSYPAAVHPPASDDEMIVLHSRSQISLGFVEAFLHNDPSAPIVRHVHLREFEGPMCGALYCTGFTEELAEAFEPDREIVMYRDEDELLAKVRFYLGHPDEAAQVREAARRRALAHHTYHARFKSLFAQLRIGR